MTRAAQQAYYSTYASGQFLQPFGVVPRHERMRNLVLAALIWGPLGLISGLIFGVNPSLAMGIAGLAFAAHSLIHPRVAIYFLIASIIMHFMIGFLPGVSTVAKIAGIWALLVSVPRIFAVVGGRADPAAKWMIGFVLISCATVFLSPLPSFSLLLTVTLVMVWSMPFLLCLQLTREDYFQAALAFLILAGTYAALKYIQAGNAEVLMERSRRPGLESIAGKAKSDVNEVARLMALGVFSTIYIFLSSRNVLKKLFCAVTGFIICIGIVISKSRACYLGVPMAVIVGLMLCRGVSVGKRTLAIMISVILLVSVFIVGGQVGFFGVGVEKRIESIFEEGAEAGGRSTLWNAYLAAAASRGFIGFGAGGTGLSRVANERGAVGRAHNDLVDIIGDFGFLGVVMFVGLNAHLARRVWRMKSKWHQFFAWMFLLFMISSGLTAFTALRKYYGIGLGLLLVGIRLSEKRDQDMTAYYHAQRMLFPGR